MTDSPSTLEPLIERANNLYSLPAVASQVLQLTNQPQVDTTALRACIENDPALTTKILKVVNSSLFGLSRRVGDLRQAIALLGTGPLQMLTLGFSLPERLFVGVAGPILVRYWRRTLTRAVASRELALRFYPQVADQAFVAGLLSDIGMLVLIGEVGAPYVAFLDKVHNQQADLHALERESLGFDHRQLSARLLEHWRLPRHLSAAVAAPKSGDTRHRHSDDESRLPRVLHLADMLARLVADGRVDLLPELLSAGSAYRGITREQVTELVEQLGDQVTALADVLSLDVGDDRDYTAILLEAHRLLAASAEALIMQGGPAQDTTAAIAPADACAGRDHSSLESLKKEQDQLAAAVIHVAHTLATEDRVLSAAPPSRAAALPVGTHSIHSHSIAGDSVANPSTAAGTGADGTHHEATHHECTDHNRTDAGGTERDDTDENRGASERASGGDAAEVRDVSSRSAAYGAAKLPVYAVSQAATARHPDPALEGRLAWAAGVCRQQRCELTLMLAEVDHLPEHILTRGQAGTAQMLRVFELACQQLDHPDPIVLATGDGCNAVLLINCDRPLAVALGQQLMRQFPRLAEAHIPQSPTELSLSIGIATLAIAPKNFDPRTLIEGADRCLYASRSSGGRTVKSIEI